jgi:large subunit ribosomal protein L27Ae
MAARGSARNSRLNKKPKKTKLRGMSNLLVSFAFDLLTFHLGNVSHGHGRVGKHRKHPGGRGNAGGLHHHRTLFDKYHPGYFGKVGQREFHKLKNRRWCPTVNLDRLWSLLSQRTQEKYTEGESAVTPVINVVRSGYFKVLGKGVLPQQPLIVKAKFFSQRAEEKIKAAGGACVLVA